MYGIDAGRGQRRPHTGTKAAAAALAAMVLLGACSSGGDEEGAAPPNSRPSVGQSSSGTFWVNPDSKAAQTLTRVRDEGRADEAELVEAIAEQPVGQWIGTEDPEAETRRVTEAAAAADRTALLVLYNIPHRDCGQYSQGGAADANAYRNWIDRVVAGIGDRETWVVLEPDALPHLLVPGCVPEEFHEEQYTLLREAVGKLGALPNTRVYLDAGNPRWVRDPGGLVEPLRRAGIEQAHGFSLNVSNYQTTRANADYGQRLSAMIDGKPFVIDTSRNGNGPVAGHEDEEAWCNPPGRALGERPTTETGEEQIDAYLWIKRPGESDGTCKGGPPAGEWHHSYALELARNAG
ncbi:MULTISPECIES: glycoside hydrolase family 6 protein [unclassified Streptomyces]|uniref:glycoside hydrolase family 6 protein n=1 Tax=unclassified Streptomyces TaxID=2593676 RepID=UPI0022B7172D|nr:MULTISPECIES: glycoside hydrolase family 6 protein [unclassified Streptomyces]MCZ7414456.1 glycoside hydrolase family 6 protein [Streptomyces sp. WMMC897]MCZ7431412.1 glycoside hydrolase family 6 protein [Streptomyces sp. WMMC1477]